MYDCNLTVDDWKKTKRLTDRADANVLPCYQKLQNDAKNEIIEKDKIKSAMTLTDTEMIIPLKLTGENMMDRCLTIPRIREKIGKCLEKVPEGQQGEACLTSKVGYDGLTSDAEYAQLSEAGEVVDLLLQVLDLAQGLLEGR